jgi:hypothetical protein
MASPLRGNALRFGKDHISANPAFMRLETKPAIPTLPAVMHPADITPS